MTDAAGTTYKVTRNFIERLACKLSDEQLAKCARDIGTSRREMQALEAERRQKIDYFKARIDGVGARIDELAEMAASGSEERDVTCQELHVFPLNIVRIVRVDTGEMLSERAMTAEERQETLFRDERSAHRPAPVGTVITVQPEQPEPPTGDPKVKALPPGPDAAEIKDPQAIIDGMEPETKTAKKRKSSRRKKK